MRKVKASSQMKGINNTNSGNEDLVEHNNNEKIYAETNNNVKENLAKSMNLVKYDKENNIMIYNHNQINSNIRNNINNNNTNKAKKVNVNMFRKLNINLKKNNYDSNNKCFDNNLSRSSNLKQLQVNKLLPINSTTNTNININTHNANANNNNNNNNSYNDITNYYKVLNLKNNLSITPNANNLSSSNIKKIKNSNYNNMNSNNNNNTTVASNNNKYRIFDNYICDNLFSKAWNDRKELLYSNQYYTSDGVRLIKKITQDNLHKKTFKIGEKSSINTTASNNNIGKRSMTAVNTMKKIEANNNNF